MPGLAESARPMEAVVFFLAGLLAVALLFPILIWLIEKSRARAYIHLPGVSGERGRGDHELLKEMLKSSQQFAVDLQSRSVSRALASGILLTLSFMLFSAKVVLFAEVEAVRWFAMAFDVCVLAMVLWIFLRSRDLRNRWIAARARVEFARQWTTVHHILLPQSDDAREAYRAQWAQICEELPDDEALTERVVRMWEERLRKLHDDLLIKGQFCASALSLYLNRRPYRQERWFREAEARTSRPRHWRERWLRVAFVICALLTLLELSEQLHLIHVGNRVEKAANFVWLSTIAFATLLVTSLYGQNSRGLLHRYSSQRRTIEEWLRRHGSALEAEIQSPGSVRRNELVESVIAFEKIMGEELVDWIEITRSDSSELAPI
ncbi:MAG TPA: hypothetical protein VF548_10415 [Allosphingosinicella sp.]